MVHTSPSFDRGSRNWSCSLRPGLSQFKGCVLRWGQGERGVLSIWLGAGSSSQLFGSCWRKGCLERIKVCKLGVGVVGIKAPSRHGPSPSRSPEGGRAEQGVSVPFPSSPSLAVHLTSLGQPQPGHAHDGPYPEGLPVHTHTHHQTKGLDTCPLPLSRPQAREGVAPLSSPLSQQGKFGGCELCWEGNPTPGRQGLKIMGFPQLSHPWLGTFL